MSDFADPSQLPYGPIMAPPQQPPYDPGPAPPVTPPYIPGGSAVAPWPPPRKEQPVPPSPGPRPSQPLDPPTVPQIPSRSSCVCDEQPRRVSQLCCGQDLDWTGEWEVLCGSYWRIPQEYKIEGGPLYEEMTTPKY